MSIGSVYKAICTKCEQRQDSDQIPEDDKIHHIYIGETARTMYIRRKEHNTDYIKAARDRVVPDKDDPKGSWMWDHMFNQHGAPKLEEIDQKKDIRFENVGGHRDPMTRQVEEAVRIIQARETTPTKQQ